MSNYLEKVNIRLCGGEEKGRRKRRKIFGEVKYLVLGGEEERRRKRRKIFGEGKLVVTQTNQPTDQQGEYSAICLFEC